MENMYFEKYLDSYCAGIIMCTADGEIEYLNKFATRILGHKNPKALLGQSIITYLMPYAEDLILDLMRELKEYKNGTNKANSTKIVQFKTDNGESFGFKANLFPSFDENGNFVKFMLVYSDFSEPDAIEKIYAFTEKNRRSLEEVITYNKSKTDFFVNISHELKTPLNIMHGAIQLIERKNIVSDIEDLDKYLEKIRINCLRLMRLTNNIIDITKWDIGNFTLKMINIDIVAVAKEIINSIVQFKPDGTDNEIKFSSEFEEKIIYCDPEKIERIMLNLVSNALKFSLEDTPVEVSIKKDGSNIAISVRDYGIGIAEKDLDLIFDRFKQVEPILTRRFEGSGIGLSIVKSLAEMHSGSIEVKSKLGEGSEFIVKLPDVLGEETQEKVNSVETEYKVLKSTVAIEFSDIG